MSGLFAHLNRLAHWVDLAPLLHLARWAYLAAAAGYMGGIYFLSSLKIRLPDTDYPRVWSFFGNLFHFPLYTGLGLLLLLGFRSTDSRESRVLGFRSVAAALPLLTLYGALDEYHQSFTGRTPSFKDFLLDVCGGLAALLILSCFLEKSLRPGLFFELFAVLAIVACLLAL